MRKEIREKILKTVSEAKKTIKEIRENPNLPQESIMIFEQSVAYLEDIVEGKMKIDKDEINQYKKFHPKEE